MEKCAIILGSATPALESFHNVNIGKYKLLKLDKRIPGAKLPKVSILDMRYVPWKGFMISSILYDKMESALKNKEQVILFLNKRGSASVVLCKSCGFTAKCKRCDLTLTYHQSKGKFLCHYCGYNINEFKKCSNCEKELEFIGMGTQKLEQEIFNLFPDYKIERLDTDSVTKKGECQRILDDFKENKINILIGTQMVAKGLDFPNVTLIGVIASDSSLNIPDFRAQERTYQLLTQVSGRSGRGQKQGEVVIQCFNPDHYSIQTSAKGSYNDFFIKEMDTRKILQYPPFSRIIELIIKGKNEKNVRIIANNIYNILLSYIGKKWNVDLLGPSPMPISFINNNHRWHLLLKSNNHSIMNQIVSKVIETNKTQKGVGVFVNVDPISMM